MRDDTPRRRRQKRARGIFWQQAQCAGEAPGLFSNQLLCWSCRPAFRPFASSKPIYLNTYCVSTNSTTCEIIFSSKNKIAEKTETEPVKADGRRAMMPITDLSQISTPSSGWRVLDLPVISRACLQGCALKHVVPRMRVLARVTDRFPTFSYTVVLVCAAERWDRCRALSVMLPSLCPGTGFCFVCHSRVLWSARIGYRKSVTVLWPCSFFALEAVCLRCPWREVSKF